MQDLPPLDELSRLRELTIRDELTGLYNRRHFSARLAQIREEADREGEHFSLLMIDLDNFKRINDSKGHLVGDEVLRRVGVILRETFREADVPCRYAGDEFTVILPDTDARGALAASNGLLDRIRADGFLCDHAVTLSIGVAVYPEIAGTPEQLFEAADRGLYRAKRGGKNALFLVTSAEFDRSTETAGLSEPLRDEAFDRTPSPFVDPLTGLYNRVYFGRRLEDEIARAGRGGKTVSVLLVGLSELDRLNEAQGFSEGDRALRRAAESLATVLGGADAVCRYAGARFAASIAADSAGARAVARELVARLSANRDKDPVPVSIGIASYPGNAERASELLHAAEVALQAAQRAVGEPIAVASPGDRGVEGPVFERFVGRRAELAALRAAFDAALAGRARPVLVVGDPGLGKTQLAHEFRHGLTRPRGGGDPEVIGLFGRFYESGAAGPYQAFRDGLVGLLGYWAEREPDRIDSVFGSLADRVFAELCGDGPSELQQYQTFEFYRQVYTRLAAVKPVVVILDDLQWADAASLELLAHLVHKTEGNRFLLVGTARRQDFKDEEHALRRWYRRLTRTTRVETLTLQPLSEEDTRALVEATFGRVSLPEHTLRQIYQETKGHPYFVSELLRLLVDEGTIYHADGWWHVDDLGDVRLPSTIVDLVELQLERLTADELDLFSQASVLGLSFTFGLLKALSGFDEERMLAHIERGLRHSVLREEQDGEDDRYSFYHSTVQRVLYERLSRRRRRALHRKAAALLESVGRGPAELAYHYVRGDEYEKALEYTVEAASAAAGAYAADEALRFFRWAVEAERTLALQRRTSEEVLGRERAVLLHLSYGRLLLSCGMMEEAAQEIANAITRAAEAGVRMLHSRALVAQSELHRTQGEFERAVASAREALDLCAFDTTPSADRERAAARMVLGDIFYRQGAMPAAAAEFREALEAAREAGDRVGEGQASRRLGIVYQKRGQYDQAQSAITRALVIARETGDRVGEGRALNALAFVYLIQNELARSLPYFQQALKAVREAGSRADEAMVLSNIGEVYRAQERFPEALDVYNQALVVAREIGDKRAEGISLLNIGLVHSDEGRHGEALALLRQALEIQREIGDRDSMSETLLSIAEVNVGQAHYEEALALAGEALELIRVNEELNLEWRALLVIGRCFVAVGRSAEGRAALANATEIVATLERHLTTGADRDMFLRGKQELFDFMKTIADEAGDAQAAAPE